MLRARRTGKIIRVIGQRIEPIERAGSSRQLTQRGLAHRIIAGIPTVGDNQRDGVTIDPHEYDRQRRAEWTRPWDDDYDEVRAESPEYFTEEDDRERAHYVALTRKTAANTQSDPE